MIKRFVAPPVTWRGQVPPWPADARRPVPGDWSWAPWTNPLWARLHEQPYPTHYVMHGGRGGGKSYTLAEYMVRLMLTLEGGQVVLALREVADSTKASIQATVHDVIASLGWSSLFVTLDRETRLSDPKWLVGLKKNRKYQGPRLLYRGLNPSAPKSVEAIKSMRNITCLVMDEAQWASERGLNLALNTAIREPGSQFVAALNPEDRNAPMQRMFIDGDAPESSCVVAVQWHSNPFFSTEANMRRLDDKRRTPGAAYRHVWLGECAPDGTLGSIVSYDALEAAMEQWKSRPDPAGKPLRVGVDLGVQGHLSTSAAFVVEGAIYEVTLDAPTTWAEYADTLLARASALKSWLGTSGLDIAFDAAGDQAASFRRELEARGAGGVDNFERDLTKLSGGSWQDPETMLIPVGFGGAVTEKDRLWETGATNGAVFATRSAQMAMVLAQRAMNAKWASDGGDPDHYATLYLNPTITNVRDYMRELTIPRWKRTGLGKRSVDKTAGMSDSPHRYDATVLAMQVDSAYGLEAAEWAAREADLADEAA